MALAKVDGILLNNDKIRKEMLKRVYWKDKQYTSFSNGDFVGDVTISTNNVSPIGEGRDLLTYTYNSANEFSKEILKHYVSNGVKHDVYEVLPITDEKRFKWLGDYYENFEPYNTRYKISEVKLVEGERKIDFSNEGRFLNEKYLTPDLLNFYGSKTASQISIVQNSILGRLDGFVHVGTGRMAEPQEANVKIIHDYNEIIENPQDFKGAGFKYLQEQLEKSNNKQYVNFVTFDSVKLSQDEDALNYFPNVSSERGLIENYDEDFSQKTYFKNGNSEGYVTYDEKDQKNDGNEYHSIQDDYSKEKNTQTREAFVTPQFKSKSLLTKTAKMFNEHKIATMIGRFHTTLSDEGVDSNATAIDSTVRKGIGNSKGRNLLTKSAEKGEKKSTNGYDNPYCRVWTYHHQYDSVSKLIRPFDNETEIGSFNPYETVYLNGENNVDGSLNGREYLKEHTVLGENGFVNIAPKRASCNETPSVEIKKCMFSIENLAWKDVPRKGVEGLEEYYISDEQRGPNGGRIMWFPPYDLNFQESVNVNWNQNNFIGRGEPVFTYSNTVRNGVLSFAILVDHPSILDNIPKNGIKEDTLSDNDILRYFAGCEVSSAFTENGVCINEVEDSITKKESEEPVETVNEYKSKHLKFNVYFPNNYSGNGVKTPKETWTLNGSSDKLWYEYLLFGKNTKLPVDGEPVGRGYEVSDNGISVNGATEGINVAAKNKPWTEGEGIVKNVYYLYRVDFDLRQKLTNVDINKTNRGMSYGTSNYIDSYSSYLNSDTTGQDDPDADNSFTEIILAMAKAQPTKFTETLVNNINTVATEPENFDELVELFKHGERIKKVKITGIATGQDSKNSQLLAKRRCKSVEGLLKNFTTKDTVFEATTGETLPLFDSTNINTMEAKQQRCASCEIWYDVPNIVNVSQNTNTLQKKNRDEEKKEILIINKKEKPSRYENESDYFKKIKNTDPLIYKKIVDKFKYFNPAFHSISPEGFNARLTFLQQCARQGHTIEATSGNFAKTAGNLSFGRMPVCVLRLGDFINTKIIINGISINYDNNGPMQWDLNPEGIGVQPMYAKISLQVTILGGQSLDGPINRLQNAVTFNYYANTGVYDNRSDRISISNTNETSNELVRIEENTVKETAGNKYTTVEDKSDYNRTAITYRHVFTPYPKINKTNK